MRISEQPTKQVPRPRVAVIMALRVGVCVRMNVGVCVGVLGAAVVVAGLVVDFRLCGGSGPVPGAVPLAHEV